MNDHDPLADLKIADPDTYLWVKSRVDLLPGPASSEALALLARETIWGLSLEAGLGEALAKGVLRLLESGRCQALETYTTLVRRAGENGATLGRILAVHLVPVLACGGDLLAEFQAATRVMLAKGTYTLNTPLEVLDSLLAENDLSSARAYLALLATIFGQDISYNRSLRLVYVIPKAVGAFPPQRRTAQITQLQQVIQKDVALIEPFLEGMEKGLQHLGPAALARFVQEALVRHARSPAAGSKFLSLASALAQETCDSLQVTVPLEQMRGQLNRYLQARLGPGIGLKAFPAGDPQAETAVSAWSDGRWVHLPEEIGRFDSQAANRSLYKALVKMEAGFFEFGTFCFDLERAAGQFPAVARALDHHPSELEQPDGCDQERFVRLFDPPALADDLLNLFEQARITRHLQHQYPGLFKQVLPLYRKAFLDAGPEGQSHPLAAAYARLVLSMPPDTFQGDPAGALGRELQTRLERHVARCVAFGSPAEICADLVCRFFQEVKSATGAATGTYVRLQTPYERRLRWEAVSRALEAPLRSAEQLNRRLAEKGLQVYRSELAARLVRTGRLCAEELQRLILSHSGNLPGVSERDQNLTLDLGPLLRDIGLIQEHGAQTVGPVFHYPEWSCHLMDYLRDYTRVQESVPVSLNDHAFYAETLAAHAGLIRHVRRAFELLRPEGLALLRQWPEGDDFDYRALLDFAVERRAGRIPSDRLFIKRLKQTRDVAVLLLLDVSRSTANPVSNGRTTVLGVAKEALIVFCEALLVVGDQFAIAGFSGTGRHAVDYYCVKDFHDPMSGAVRRRISALAPQRSTRMGAAIRHAAARIQKVEAQVRLLMVLSDGFPNDLGYKADYAIGDTRRAVQEARANGCFVKALTVNMGSDPRLDDLYGPTHHHVIGDVRELPDRLIRLYGALTRMGA